MPLALPLVGRLVCRVLLFRIMCLHENVCKVMWCVLLALCLQLAVHAAVQAKLTCSFCVHCDLVVQKRTEMFNNVKRAEAAATVLTFFGSQSREMNCCMLCKRDFTSEQELGARCTDGQMSD